MGTISEWLKKARNYYNAVIIPKPSPVMYKVPYPGFTVPPLQFERTLHEYNRFLANRRIYAADVNSQMVAEFRRMGEEAREIGMLMHHELNDFTSAFRSCSSLTGLPRGFFAITKTICTVEGLEFKQLKQINFY